MKTKSPIPFWPCPHRCTTWVRTDVRFMHGVPQPCTNHHPNCEHVDASLIDVWRVSYGGSSYVDDREPKPDQLGEGEVVTKEKMHRDIYDALPEFGGF